MSRMHVIYKHHPIIPPIVEPTHTTPSLLMSNGELSEHSPEFDDFINQYNRINRTDIEKSLLDEDSNRPSSFTSTDITKIYDISQQVLYVLHEHFRHNQDKSVQLLMKPYLLGIVNVLHRLSYSEMFDVETDRLRSLDRIATVFLIDCHNHRYYGVEVTDIIDVATNIGSLCKKFLQMIVPINKNIEFPISSVRFLPTYEVDPPYNELEMRFRF